MQVYFRTEFVMKKIAAIIALLAVMLSTQSGCFMIPKNTAGPSTSTPSGNSQDAQTTGSASDTGSIIPATNPSQGYNNYITIKSNATQRIMDAAEKSDSLALTVSMNLMGVTFTDLYLIPLTVFGSDAQAVEMALGFFQIKDVKYNGSGNEFSISYTDANGATIKQTCTYDPAKDQMTSTVYDADGNISVFFEYVNQGNNTYASQYYFLSNGSYEVMRAYFDQDNVAAFSTVTAAEEPASILGKTGLNEDFVKNSETYMILKDGKLTVFDKGATSTN